MRPVSELSVRPHTPNLSAESGCAASDTTVVLVRCGSLAAASLPARRMCGSGGYLLAVPYSRYRPALLRSHDRIRTRRRLGAASPKPASGVYIDR
jgi:hypothetical protein